MNTVTADLIDLVRRAYDGDAWHGTPTLTALAGIDSKTAGVRVTPGTHTIWEIVLHITGWMNEVAQRLRGNPAGNPPEGDWPPMPEANQNNWEQTIEGLARAQGGLVQSITAFPVERLSIKVPDPREEGSSDVTFAGTIHGLLQHNAYHTGQILLLRKAIADGIK